MKRKRISNFLTEFNVGDHVRHKTGGYNGKLFRVDDVVVKMSGATLTLSDAFSPFQKNGQKKTLCNPSDFMLVTVEEIQDEIDKLLEIQRKIVVSEVMGS